MSSDPYDRMIHAVLPDGGQVVRYDSSSKWFLEYPSSTLKPRQKLTIRAAVNLALDSVGKPGARVNLGRAGGMRFDSLFRQLKEARREAARDRASNPLRTS